MMKMRFQMKLNSIFFIPIAFVFITLIYYFSSNYRLTVVTKIPAKQVAPIASILSAFPSDVLVVSKKIIDSANVGGLELKDVSETTFSFLTVLNEHEINAFIIEPCVLWNVISKDDQDLLMKRASVPQFATSCYPTQANGSPLMTLGVMESDSSNMGSSLLQDRLKKDQFQVDEFWDPKTGQLSHYMVKKGTQVIHTVTFFKRNSFLLVHELTSPSFGVSVKELRFGATAMAFEDITLSHYLLNKVNVLLPKNIKQFLFEIPHSQFLECRHDLAAKFNVKYPLKNSPLRRLQETIQVMRNITYKTIMPIWLDGGSLIGWARHCGAIPYERDADFASWGHILGTDYDLPQQIINSVDPPWYFIETFGLPWTGYELRLYNIQLDWQVDFFFTSQDEEDKTQSYLGYHTFPGVYFIKLYYKTSIFATVCSGEVLGQKIMVPCHYDALLTEEYGTGWSTPDETHFLKYQPRQHRTYWTEEEGFYAYQCLGRNQFDIRKFNHSNYKYTPDRENIPADLSQAYGSVINEYKAVCTRLRWNRTW